MITTYDIPGYPPPAQGCAATATTRRTLVHVAGQVGSDESGALVPGGLAAQTEQALRNVARALATAGASVHDVVKMTIYVVGWEPTMIGEFLAGASAAGDGGPPPSTAYTLLGVHSLFTPDVLVEIEAVAAIGA